MSEDGIIENWIRSEHNIDISNCSSKDETKISMHISGALVAIWNKYKDFSSSRYHRFAVLQNGLCFMFGSEIWIRDKICIRSSEQDYMDISKILSK